MIELIYDLKYKWVNMYPVIYDVNNIMYLKLFILNVLARTYVNHTLSTIIILNRAISTRFEHTLL